MNLALAAPFERAWLRVFASPLPGAIADALALQLRKAILASNTTGLTKPCSSTKNTHGSCSGALIRQSLLLSRKEITQVTEVNLNDVIAEFEKMLATVIGGGIRLETVLSPALGFVLADPGQLHQVLMHLTVNARDAMPDGGTLQIETRNIDPEEAAQYVELKPGRYVQLKVSDSGIGMTKEVMPHIFDLFFTTKRPGEGTGLGLSIVYGVVKQCNGSIWVYSQPGEGTTFRIYFPRIDAAVRLPQEPPIPLAPLPGAETVLVVEDQNQLRILVGRVLRSHGYRVLEAANAEEALLHSERHTGPIHVLLADVVLPGMSGPELANCIKTPRPSIKTIFMSGYSEGAIADRRILELAGSYLPKPFSPDVLAAKVREVLGSSRSAE
jgi:two-component system, cell cycle sensor histidine kinase and response regulator CckA